MINNIMNIAEYKHEAVSGQGSVSWDDGVKCYIPSVKVTGKAEQTTYSGINLLPCKGGDLSIGSTYEFEGRSYAVDMKGAVTITCSSSEELSYVYYVRNVYLTSGQKYTFSGLTFRISNNGVTIMDLNATKSPVNYEAAEGDYIAAAWFRINAGERGEGTYYPMMCEGTYNSATLPPHEPYVGGMSAPNPQYPFYPTFTAPKLASHGKNLFDISDVTTAFNSRGARVPVSQNYPYQIYPNGEIEIGVSSSYNGLYWSDNGVYLPAGIYTVSADLFIPSTSTSTVYNFGARNFDENTSFLGRFTDSKVDEWFRAIYTFTATNGVYRFLAQIVGGSSYTDVCVRVKNIQIEKNNTYTGFEKYFSGSVVQCPELYATIGNEYLDTYDTQTGNITRKILKALLTGNETITASTAFGNGVRIANIFDGTSADGYIGLCSHAVVGESMHFTPLTGSVFWHNILGELNMTLEEFKVWLAEQYNSGKPVTIWYPLLYSTEATVPMPEKLKMPKGSGQIIQTDSGLVADIEAKVLKHS